MPRGTHDQRELKWTQKIKGVKRTTDARPTALKFIELVRKLAQT